MPEYFALGDTHFGHVKLVTPEEGFTLRPFKSVEEHDETLVMNWNNKVPKKSKVLLYGDVCVGGPLTDRIRDILKSLNGEITVIGGNHDSFAKSREYISIFKNFVGCMELFGNSIHTHIPVHPSEFERFKFNIHGHKHSKKVIDPVTGNVDQRYFCVSCEQVNYTPIAMDDIFTELRVAGIL